MKIVIDIPEWKYKSICEGVEASKRCGVVGKDAFIHEAIKNGTPLPKGHGRLGDLDALEKEMEDYSEGAFAMTPEFLVKHAPTIIEADIAESEE